MMTKDFYNRKAVKKSNKPTPSELLIERLRKEKGYEFSKEAKIVRTGASKDWRSSGRWLWQINDPNTSIFIGSDFGVRELLKFKFLQVSHSEGGRLLGYDYQP